MVDHYELKLIYSFNCVIPDNFMRMNLSRDENKTILHVEGDVFESVVQNEHASILNSGLNFDYSEISKILAKGNQSGANKQYPKQKEYAQSGMYWKIIFFFKNQFYFLFYFIMF